MGSYVHQKHNLGPYNVYLHVLIICFWPKNAGDFANSANWLVCLTSLWVYNIFDAVAKYLDKIPSFLHDFDPSCHKTISHVQLSALCKRRNEIKEIYIFFCLAKFNFCQFGALLSKIEIIGQQVCKTVHIKWENYFGTTNKIFYDVKIFNRIYGMLCWIIKWYQ